MRVVPDRGGTGGMTLPYRQREPLEVFVRWSDGVQDAFGKSTLGASWRIGWREQDSVQGIHAVVRSPRKKGLDNAGLGRQDAAGSPPKEMDPLCPASPLDFPASQTPTGTEPLTWEPGGGLSLFLSILASPDPSVTALVASLLVLLILLYRTQLESHLK